MSSQLPPELRTFGPKARVLLEGVTRLTGNPNDVFDIDDIDKDINAESEGRSSMYNLGNSNWERNGNINVRRFLLQSNYDASVSDEVIQKWISQLEHKLACLTVK